jgi:hypothetical protein
LIRFGGPVFTCAFGVEQTVGGLFHSAALYLPLLASSMMAGANSGSMPPLLTGLPPFLGLPS